MNPVYEVIGYVASALIIVSVTRSSLLKLRIFGLLGSVTFTIYGLLIGAYPIAVVNAVITGIHIAFLRSLRQEARSFFRVLPVAPDSAYLAYFLDFYATDIARYAPAFRHDPAGMPMCVFILRDAVPAGIFIGRTAPDGTLEVLLDYATPAYRDFKVGRYLYSKRSGVFSDPKVSTAWSAGGTELHHQYLQRMGFTPSERNGERVWTRDLRALHGAVRRS